MSLKYCVGLGSNNTINTDRLVFWECKMYTVPAWLAVISPAYENARIGRRSDQCVTELIPSRRFIVSVLQIISLHTARTHTEQTDRQWTVRARYVCSLRKVPWSSRSPFALADRSPTLSLDTCSLRCLLCVAASPHTPTGRERERKKRSAGLNLERSWLN